MTKQSPLGTLAFTLLLVGCAMAPQFSGNSVADATLRADVFSHIRLLSRAAKSCNRIDAVQTKVVKIDKTGGGNIARVQEVWMAEGCGKTVNYNVALIPDAKGETDFVVGLSGAQP